MSITVYYTTNEGIDQSRQFDDWMSANLFEMQCREGDCENIRIIQAADASKWDSLLIDAAYLIYKDGLSPMMALAHLLYRRGLSSNDAATILSEITGKEIRPSCAREYMRRANEKIGET